MDASSLLHAGSGLFDKTGSKVGTVRDVVLEPATLKPEWYDVKVGMLGGHRLVPADCVTVEAEPGAPQYGVVSFDKNMIRAAPGAHIPPLPKEERSLQEHYRAA
jgi:PRC-barrel domain